MKDLRTLVENLEIIGKSGIEKVKVFPEDDQTRIKGMDDDQSPTVLIDDHIPDIGVDRAMIIPHLSQFLAKMQLFDLDKVKITEQGSDEYYRNIEFRQGNRKTLISMGNKSSMKNFEIPEDRVVFQHKIDSTEFASINKAIAATNKGGKVTQINFSSNGEKVFVNIKDDITGDFYQDMITELEENESDRWSHQWNKTRFVSLVREAIRLNEEKPCSTKVTEHGIMFIDVGGLKFALSPMVQ